MLTRPSALARHSQLTGKLRDRWGPLSMDDLCWRTGTRGPESTVKEWTGATEVSTKDESHELRSGEGVRGQREGKEEEESSEEDEWGSLLCQQAIWTDKGKKRLVIDYQPLNFFLRYDKFPLSNIVSLFPFLSKAKIFSKFDLKVSFWQLGIQTEERCKTAFYIPNQHFQWTVVPFGLKVAPSLFQKVMIKIYKPNLSYNSEL